MDPRWLSVEEIAKYLGVIEETVYRWIKRQGMPAHRVGKLWKFKVEEVDRWINSGKSQAKKRKRKS